MKQTRTYELKQTNREQRETITEQEETIKLLSQQLLETKISLYNRLVKISRIGHSDDMYKNIKMTDLLDKTIEELYKDLEIDLVVENDEEGKIIELDESHKHI